MVKQVIPNPIKHYVVARHSPRFTRLHSLRPVLLNLGLGIILPLSAIAIFASPAIAANPSYHIDSKNSVVEFKAMQQNVPTKGSFAVEGTIQFDPNHLETSVIDVSVPIKTLQTTMKDVASLLNTPDWLDSSHFPTASFRSNSIKKAPNQSYLTAGNLTIAGHTKPIQFRFVLDQHTPTITKGHAALTIQRLDFNIGKGEWKDTTTVQNAVILNISITARR